MPGPRAQPMWRQVTAPVSSGGRLPTFPNVVAGRSPLFICATIHDAPRETRFDASQMTKS